RAGDVSSLACTTSGVIPQSRAKITVSNARAKSWPRLMRLSGSICHRLRFRLDQRRRRWPLSRFAFDLVQDRRHSRACLWVRLQSPNKRGAKVEVLRLDKHADVRAHLMRSQLTEQFSNQLQIAMNGSADLGGKSAILCVHRVILNQQQPRALCR